MKLNDFLYKILVHYPVMALVKLLSYHQKISGYKNQLQDSKEGNPLLMPGYFGKYRKERRNKRNDDGKRILRKLKP